MAYQGMPSDWDVITEISVNGSTYTEITYTKAIKSFTIKTRQKGAFRWKRLTTDTKYFSIDPGQIVDSKILLTDKNYASSSMGFVLLEDPNATDTIEGIVYFG